MDKVLKCLVVGDDKIGKTNLLNSFTQKTFPSEYLPTVFQNNYVEVRVGNTVQQVFLEDTEGQADIDRVRLEEN